MSTNIFLTDETSNISGYKRAKLSNDSDCCSLVRSVINTVAGPTEGVTAGSWITDLLNATSITAAAWTLHLWAQESDDAANISLRVKIYQFTNSEDPIALLDSNAGTELPTTTQDSLITTSDATATALSDGNRLVIKVLFDDTTADSMATGYTGTFSYNGEYVGCEGNSYLICPNILTVTETVPSDTRQRVRRLMKDADCINSGLSDEEIDQTIRSAVSTYNRVLPRIVSEYRSGDGSTYKFSLPSKWIWGFSRIVEIEYPISTSQYRTFLEFNNYEILDTILGPQPYRKLSLFITPDIGVNNFLISYTTTHSHNDELNTIPDENLEAICFLAASYSAMMMSAKMSGSNDTTIAADAVNYRDGQLRYKQVSEMFNQRYLDHMGLVGVFVSSSGKPGSGVSPASITKDWNTSFSWGTDRLFHSRRRR